MYLKLQLTGYGAGIIGSASIERVNHQSTVGLSLSRHAGNEAERRLVSPNVCPLSPVAVMRSLGSATQTAQ